MAAAVSISPHSSMSVPYTAYPLSTLMNCLHLSPFPPLLLSSLLIVSSGIFIAVESHINQPLSSLSSSLDHFIPGSSPAAFGNCSLEGTVKNPISIECNAY